MIRRVACPAAPAARRPAHLAPPATAAAAHAPAARRGARSRVGPRWRALRRRVQQAAQHAPLHAVLPLALQAALWWQRGLRLDRLTLGTLGLFGVVGPAFGFGQSGGRLGRGWSGGASALRKKRKMRRKPSLGRARAACRDRRGAGRALAWPRLRHPVHGPPHWRVRREVRRAAFFASFACAPRQGRIEAGQPAHGAASQVSAGRPAVATEWHRTRPCVRKASSARVIASAGRLGRAARRGRKRLVASRGQKRMKRPQPLRGDGHARRRPLGVDA